MEVAEKFWPGLFLSSLRSAPWEPCQTRAWCPDYLGQVTPLPSHTPASCLPAALRGNECELQREAGSETEASFTFLLFQEQRMFMYLQEAPLGQWAWSEVAGRGRGGSTQGAPGLGDFFRESVWSWQVEVPSW